MSCTVHIRPATLFDANEIARINVQTWLSTYDGLIEDRMLKSLSESKRREFWYKVISEALPQRRILVAERTDPEANGRLAAYISGGLSRISGFEAEVYALYCDQLCQGHGIGTQLLLEFFDYARSERWRTVCVRVLSANPYKSFYYKHGAVYDHVVMERIGERDYEEEVAVWTLDQPK